MPSSAAFCMLLGAHSYSVEMTQCSTPKAGHDSKATPMLQS